MLRGVDVRTSEKTPRHPCRVPLGPLPSTSLFRMDAQGAEKPLRRDQSRTLSEPDMGDPCRRDGSVGLQPGFPRFLANRINGFRSIYALWSMVHNPPYDATPALCNAHHEEIRREGRAYRQAEIRANDHSVAIQLPDAKSKFSQPEFASSFW